VPGRVVEAVRDFTRAIVSSSDLDELLETCVEQACRVFGADAVVIGLRDRDGRLRPAAASDPAVEAAERAAADGASGEGVSHGAFVSGTVVATADLTRDPRWPGYAEHAATVGLRAAMAAPMVAAQETIGTLGVYRAVPSEWSTEELELCEVLAAMSAAYVHNATQLQASSTLADQLQHALDARVLIEQAKGALMAKESLTAATAFERLREEARSTNRKVRDVADELVSGLE
jgi:GAF domain-containing protein